MYICWRLIIADDNEPGNFPDECYVYCRHMMWYRLCEPPSIFTTNPSLWCVSHIHNSIIWLQKSIHSIPFTTQKKNSLRIWYPPASIAAAKRTHICQMPLNRCAICVIPQCYSPQTIQLDRPDIISQHRATACKVKKKKFTSLLKII